MAGLLFAAGAGGQPTGTVADSVDGRADARDYAAFLELYSLEDPRADLNRDGLVDFNDVLEFLASPSPLLCTPISVPLASNPLAIYPHAEFVDAFNDGEAVSISVDPWKQPQLTGQVTKVYIVKNKSTAEWGLNPTLTDVRGVPQSITWPGGTIQTNTFTLTGADVLGFDAGEDVGVGYDLVIDADGNGVLTCPDLIDGYAGTVGGFYKVRDLTTANLATTVTQANTVSIPVGRTDAGFEDERWYYPTNLAARGQLPLVMISHGNGHQYIWYDHLGQHLASYGYIVIAHESNTEPDFGEAAISLLDHTNTVIALQSSLGGGVLDGHINPSEIYWIGHSRGGEAVSRGYRLLVDNQYIPTGGFARVINAGNIKYIQSIAPTDMLGITAARPVDYHMIYGAADGDVTGGPDDDDARSLPVYERASQRRSCTYIQGVGHNEFNCCGVHPYDPCPGCPNLIGRPAAQAIQKAVTLASIKYYRQGNIPSREYLWRQWERFRPIGVSATAVVDCEFKDFGEPGVQVIDNFQDGADTLAACSSSNWTGSATVTAVAEGPRLRDTNELFAWPGDVWNGMTRAGPADTTDGLVFEYDSTVTSRELAFTATTPVDMSPGTGREYLSFRACQITRHTYTTGVLADQDFEVQIEDTSGNKSKIRVSAYGGGIEEPYQRAGRGAGSGWANEFETIRIRLTDFTHPILTTPGLPDLTQIKKIRFLFGSAHGTSQGRLAIDDIELTR